MYFNTKYVGKAPFIWKQDFLLIEIDILSQRPIIDFFLYLSKRNPEMLLVGSSASSRF